MMDAMRSIFAVWNFGVDFGMLKQDELDHIMTPYYWERPIALERDCRIIYLAMLDDK